MANTDPKIATQEQWEDLATKVNNKAGIGTVSSSQVAQLTDKDGNNIFPIAGGMASGSITTAMLQDGAVTAAKFASPEDLTSSLSINRNHITPSTGTATKLRFLRFGNLYWLAGGFTTTAQAPEYSQLITVPSRYRAPGTFFTTITENTGANPGYGQHIMMCANGIFEPVGGSLPSGKMFSISAMWMTGPAA